MHSLVVIWNVKERSRNRRTQATAKLSVCRRYLRSGSVASSRCRIHARPLLHQALLSGTVGFNRTLEGRSKRCFIMSLALETRLSLNLYIWNASL